MLQEEVSELEAALDSEILSEILAESVDVIYLTLKLMQDCGLEHVIESAVALKRGDNTQKQHDAIPQQSQTIFNDCLRKIPSRDRRRHGLHHYLRSRRQAAALLKRQTRQAT